MGQPGGLNDELEATVDDFILACDPEGAYWKVRESNGVGPEEAAGIVRRRFKELRTSRPGEFAWRDFPCADYLGSVWADEGCWDEASEFLVIVPAWEVKVRDENGFLVVGGPGVDGIAWGYRREHAGLWAYHPIERAFVPVASTIGELAEKWLSGNLTV